VRKTEVPPQPRWLPWIAVGIAITTYQEIIRWIGNGDPTTRRLIEKILEQEAEHSNDLQDFLGI
jgi:bacterioferritin